MMQFFRNVFICTFLVFVLNSCSKQEQSAANHCQRIISLAPSITETLFALGLEDRVIGVTTYCNYPLRAREIEKVGGYADANLEKIIALKPDLVIMTNEHEKQNLYLQRFSIKTLVIENHSLAAVCSSFSAIGRHCGVENGSDSLIRLFATNLTKQKHADSSLPKVLLCVGRDNPGAGRIGSIFSAGKSTFYDELILAAGGVNAFTQSSPAYPRLSVEGIMSLAPDIIIDIAPSMGDYSCSLLVADWYSLDRVPAVRNNNVFCLTADYATIPGPRMLLLLEDLREMLMRNEE